MTRLVIEGLRKRFGAVQALKSLDLDITEGELISLLGPSGCGKTTTLRCVAGFEFPDEGTIRFDGQDITKLPPEKRDLGMVFQNYALFPHMTVEQNLAFGLEMRRVDRESARQRIDQALKMVQLGAMQHRYPRQLSGGQQQRVALARALVIEPRVLLLDEPLANLDASLREEMRFFIRDLQKRVGITTLYVTHDQSEAMVMSDRVVVMFDGEVAQFGAPEEIYARPCSRRVAQFIGRTCFIAGRVDHRIDGTLLQVATPMGAIVSAGDPSLAAGDATLLAVRPEAIELLSARVAGSAESPAVYRCRVDRTYFLGGTVDHALSCEGGIALTAQTPPGRSIAAGHDACLRIDPQQVWALRDQAAA